MSRFVPADAATLPILLAMTSKTLGEVLGSQLLSFRGRIFSSNLLINDNYK